MRRHVEDEAFEQRLQVMRSRTCLRMPLEAENRMISQLNALQREIEQGPVGRFDALGQGLLVDRKAMILARNYNLPGFEILDRVIGAVMAEFHLDGFGARRKRQQLVSEANTENWNTDVY